MVKVPAMNVLVRTARLSDAEGIARLTGQLGYDVDEQAVTTRLSGILARQDQQFLVAELDGHLVGWLHAVVAEFVETGSFVVIGGLVVDAEVRRKGIGRTLLARAEEWAVEQRCSIVRLWSSVSRNEAHRFYEQLGYRNIKTQYAFVKAVDPEARADFAGLVPRQRSRDST